MFFKSKFPNTWQENDISWPQHTPAWEIRSIKPIVVPTVAYTNTELHKLKIFQFHQEKALFPLSHTFTPESCPVQSQFDWNSCGVMHQHQQPTLGEGRNEASHSPTCPAARLIIPVTLKSLGPLSEKCVLTEWRTNLTCNGLQLRNHLSKVPSWWFNVVRLSDCLWQRCAKKHNDPMRVVRKKINAAKLANKH